MTSIILTNLEELFPEVGVEPPIEDGVADTGGERDTVTNAQDEVVHLNRHLVTHHSFIMLVIVMIGFGIYIIITIRVQCASLYSRR